MDELEFPPRLYTLGQEPLPIKSIGYYCDDSKLFAALEEALEPDEWDELKNSKLGVFLKFHEMPFGWASRLVHYMLCFQLECKKKFEMWCLVGVQPVRFSLHEFEYITGLNCEYVKNLDNPLVEVTDEMRVFWEKLGVSFERGPSIEELTAACKLCGSWSREDRLRLGYLAIYVGFIEAPRTSSPTKASLARLVMDLEAFEDYPWGRVAFKALMKSVKDRDITKSYTLEGWVQVLQVWVYYALPEYAAGYGSPLEDNPSPLMLAFEGSRGRKNVKENIQSQSRVNNFVVKDYSEMFPLWDGEIDDARADNLVKAMFDEIWKRDKSHWPPVGIKLWTNVKVEYQQVKTEGGHMVTDKKAGKRPVSPSLIESDDESRKKARESHALDRQAMKAEIEIWLTGLTSKLVEGLSRCESTMSKQAQMIEILTNKVSAVEKIVRGKEEEDEVDQSDEDGDEEDKACEEEEEEAKAREEKEEEVKAREKKIEGGQSS